MSPPKNNQNRLSRLCLRLIAFIGLFVPRRLRTDWRQEWEAELLYRESRLQMWRPVTPVPRLNLLRRTLGAFRDALLLQPRRLEEEMFQDLRYGARMLRANPGFTAAAVLCLALGIGANTAIFSLVSALLLRQLPLPSPGELVVLSRGDGLGPPVSYIDFTALRERNEVLSGLAAYSPSPFSFGRGARSEVVLGEVVSGNYFDVLQIEPSLGRAFLPEEDHAPGANPVVIISNDFWRDRFDGDLSVIGRTITLNGYQFTVIGVAPAGFSGASVPTTSKLWVPAMMRREAMPSSPPDLLTSHRHPVFGAIGRLKPGVSLESAQASLEVLNRQLLQADPAPANQSPIANENRALKLIRPQGIYLPHLRRLASIASTLLAAVVGIVLLIACANVANLLLARATARRKEIAIRLALGASRLRLVRQLLIESILLAFIGAGAGLLLAYWVNQVLMTLKPPIPPPWVFSVDLRLDAGVLGFTALLAVGSGILFGLAPALQASSSDLVPALKDESGSESRRARWFGLRNAIVIVQLAVSLVLLISAGLFIRSLQHAQQIETGFRTEKRIAVSFDLQLQAYDEARGREFYRRLVESAGALPGARSVSLVNYLPLGFGGRGTQINADGREPSPNAQPEFATYQIISVRYFETMGTRIVRGRNFSERDKAGSPEVVIINETLARRFWPQQEALGQRLRVGPRTAPLCEVVGIVEDTVAHSLGEDRQSIIYRPFEQDYSAAATLVVETTGDPKAMVPSIRREVLALDENLPLQGIKTVDEHLSLSLWPARMGAAVLVIFGLLGLVLASVGVYGVMAYSVSLRTREIGLRMALGAQAGDVLRLVVWKGFALALVGTLIGLGLALATGRLLAGLLYGVSATDALTFIGVPLLLISVALIACYIPARRAMRVDPMVALRHE